MIYRDEVLAVAVRDRATRGLQGAIVWDAFVTKSPLLLPRPHKEATS